jgi:hypothetical protein
MKPTIISLFLSAILLTSSGCSKDNATEPKGNNHVPPPVADAAAWTVKASDYEHLMTVVAQLRVDRQLACGLNNKIAAFSGSEVRGVASPYEHGGCTVYSLVVFSNDLSDTLTFGAYLADRNMTVATTNRIVFEAGKGIGKPDDPYVLEVR